MKSPYAYYGFFVALVVLFPLIVVGAETVVEEEDLPTVEEIVNNTNRVAYYQGRDGRARVKMIVTDSRGNERTREFTILRLDEQPDDAASDAICGDQKLYVYFHRPADVNKMVFMVWKHVGKDDDRWLYLPSLDLVNRIAAADKRTSFVGSDFFYEDVSGRDINEDEHELIKTTENYFVLKNTPKNTDSVEFSYYQMWIYRKTFLPVKTEYFDKKGEKYRVYEAKKVESIDGYPTVVRSTMTDLRTESTTSMEYKNVKYNIDLPEEIFTERYLRNAPRKHLR